MATVEFSGTLAQIQAQMLEFLGLTREGYEEAMKPAPAPVPWPFPIGPGPGSTGATSAEEPDKRKVM